MPNNIWFEVDKSNGVILSYFLEVPSVPSSKCDYIEGTQDELTFLDALEDTVFSPGMVATLSDLQDHRARVAAAKRAQAGMPGKAAHKGPQKPVESSSQSGNTNPSTDKQRAKASFIAALKQHRSNK